MRQSNHHKHSRSRSRSHSPKKWDESRDERPSQRFKLEETRTLLLEGVAHQSNKAEAIFTDLSITIGTSVPDQVDVQGNNVYIRYPSVEAAKTVFEYLHGEAVIDDRKVKIQYFPIRRVDLTLAYDWYCQKCDYKNFARRNHCYRCQSQKTQTCKLSYSTQPTTSKPLREQSAQNCSLMLRGNVLTDIQQNLLLSIFQALAPVKDIRQIKNKLTDKFKDFAFIQFYSPQETAQAFKQASSMDFKIAGQKVTVMYSRNKSDEDYFKPLPYESGRREKKMKDKNNQQDNYYHRQRQREIQQEKARPAITMEQLKQKHELQLKKNQPAAKEMSQQQSRRRQAQMLAKQWEREMKVQTIMYICPACNRKFQSLDQMKMHQKHSQLHRFQMNKLHNTALAL